MAFVPMSSIARVFIDASAFRRCPLARGYARDPLLAGMHRLVVLSCSSFALDETERNLSVKAPAALPAFRLFRQTLATQLVTPARAQVLRTGQVIDIKDAPIVAGAVRARALYLATYDRRHLLSQAQLIESIFGIVVATPDAILAATGLRDRDPVA